MDKLESKEILSNVLATFRAKTYVQLVKVVESKFSLKHTHYEEIETANGTSYQIRVNVFWNDQKAEILRVVGSIDDGGTSAILPVSEDFLLNSNGKFINE